MDRGRAPIGPPHEFDPGCVRLQEAGTTAPSLVAGDDGAQLVVLVADRRAFGAALDAGTVDLPTLRGTVAELREQLQPVA